MDSSTAINSDPIFKTMPNIPHFLATPPGNLELVIIKAIDFAAPKLNSESDQIFFSNLVVMWLSKEASDWSKFSNCRFEFKQIQEILSKIGTENFKIDEEMTEKNEAEDGNSISLKSP